MATARRNALVNLLVTTANDDNLREIADGFFGPPREFPVEHSYLTIVGPGADTDITWESMTTRLAKLGFAFGDVLAKEGKLYRAVANGDGAMWVTSGAKDREIGRIDDPSGLEKHDGEVASDASERDRLSNLLKSESGDVECTLRNLPGSLKSPRFRVEPRHLEIQGDNVNAILGWSNMTTNLRDEMGCAFGDVLWNKRHKCLCRAVACQGSKFWTTSSIESNRLDWSLNKDDYEKM